ncbi:MAG: hypothetical protein F4Y63_01035 [Chloroflexi bacterium]|nr:hypothetical protein [Chloroflexota bacterium]
MSSDPKSESTADNLPPASQSNRARQTRSRKNITHPITFKDETLEKAYNRKRNVPKSQRKSELRRLH